MGIPTVADRIAQMVVQRRLEPLLEPVFHANSYGYRPGRSAHDALRAARTQCWRHDWVLDLDIKGFFDNIDSGPPDDGGAQAHGLPVGGALYRALAQGGRAHARRDVDCARQGHAARGCCQPLLANLFLHYAFDQWMVRHHPKVPFERYADDIICHCDSEAEAESLRAAIADRLAACRLELHPEKTRVVYCADANRRGDHGVRQFDFLGYTFKPRQAMNRRRQLFTSFAPAVSDKAGKAMRHEIRGWDLKRLQPPRPGRP